MSLNLFGRHGNACHCYHRNRESDLVTMTTERDDLTLEVARLTEAMERAELKEKELIDQLKQAEEEIAKRDQIIM